MKRFLPIFLLLVVFAASWFVPFASAQQSSLTPSPSVPVSLTPTPTIPSSLQQNQISPADLPQNWIIDPEVTSIGKNAARSGIFLDWALQNYDWSYVQPGLTNPLIPFWITMRNTVYAFLVLVIIAGALTLIMTRGRSVTLRRFLPRFLMIVILVTFSFAFVQVLYQIIDIFQGFFIRPGGIAISQKNLLFVGWNYQPFVGLRALGDENFESAFISLLLVKLTSFTYYAMVGILLVRKIILWFFIMISPFFPLLLLFYPLRNTAKIWLGEFFRWLLYAPLFAIFLAGLVSLWKTGIPLFFNFSEAGKGVVFPTAVSILLGGPLQKVGVANSVNLADTFGLYIVALLMLWMVIIFPFVLLQIFLDYLNNFNVNQNPLARQLVNFMAKFPSSPPSSGPSPQYQPTGLARALPFLRDFAIPTSPATTGLAREIPRQTQEQTVIVKPVSTSQKEEVQKLTNISIPTLRDIARMESLRLTKDTESQKEKERVSETLRNIAQPESISKSVDRERFTDIRDQLTKESKSGNQVATHILQTAKSLTSQAATSVQNITNITTLLNQLANPATITTNREREKVLEVRERVIKESRSDNTLATNVMTAMNNVSNQSKNTLTSLIETLSHPEDVPSKLKENMSELKETLMKESEKGNSIASTVLSLVERFESVEKVSTMLLGVLHPEKVTEKTEKERFEKIKETIIKEKEQNNTLATSITESMQKLSEAKTVEEKSDVLESIKETITKEQANTLATYLKEQLPQLMQLGGSVSLDKTQQAIEKARADGSPLGQKLMEIAQETSKEKQKEAISHLQEEITKAKATGDPLATLLLGMMTPKPKVAGKPELFPTTNRIQDVSLDDYEAVKQMWTENYQNIQTTGNAEDQEASIKGDIQEITDTIGLLTSQDVEKVEEGMQKVSDILPFLLIGGFSQSEIVAYLKAKLEAGKDVLSDIEKEAGKEDTKLTIEQKQTAAPKTATVSAEVAEPTNDSYTLPVVQSTVSFKAASAPVIEKVSQEILHLTSLQLPNLRTVASLDASLLTKSGKGAQDAKEVQEVLTSIVSPALVKDETEKKRFGQIHEVLQKESEKGNVLASSILSAGRLVAKPSLSNLLQALLGVRNAGESEEVVRLRQELSDAKNKGNTLASLILTKADEQTRQQIQAVAHILQKIHDPEKVADPIEKATYEDMLARLEKEHLAKNVLADEILTTARMLATETTTQLDRVTLSVLLWQKLLLEKEKGSEVASILLSKADAIRDKERLHMLLSDIIRNIRNPEGITDLGRRQVYQAFKKMLIQESGKGNVLAKELFAVTTPSSVKDQSNTQVVASVFDQLEEQARGGNVLAKELTDLLTKEEESIPSFATLQFLQLVHDPQKAGSTKEQEEYTLIKDALQKATQADNTLAMSILSASERIGMEGNDLSEARKVQELLQDNTSPVAENVRKMIGVEKERQENILLLRSMLHNLQDPKILVDTPIRKQYEVLLQQITLEAQHGNEAANAITKALHQTSELSVSVDQEMHIITDLYQHLLGENEKGNVRAKEMLTFVMELRTKRQASHLVEVLENIANTQSNLGENQVYKKVKQELVIGRNKGDQVASLILSVSNAFASKQIAEEDMFAITATLIEKLTIESGKGNTFASSILAKVNRSDTKVLPELESAIVTARAEKDPVAEKMFSLIKTGGEKSVDVLVLPDKNNLQEVSLDDYDAVRTMWIETYRTLDVPESLSHEKPSRVSWLQGDSKRVQTTIDKLSSVDKEQIHAGMQDVVSILPFLLLGGFSLSEIIAYLKAKLQAAKTVLAEIEQSTPEQKVTTSKRSEPSKEVLREES